MIPPYRDPELRRAFALSAHEQRALLMRMAGEAEPAPLSSTFTPHPIQARRTEKSLVVIARPFPQSVVMTDTSAQLTVLVEHGAFNAVADCERRQQPRHPEAVAELETALTNIAPNIGVWSVPFPPPKAWTRASVRRLLAVLASYVPNDGRKLELRASWGSSWRPYVEISVGQDVPGAWRRLEDRPYAASIRLHPETAKRALREWLEVFAQDTGGTLHQIDKALQEHANRRRDTDPGSSSRRSTRRLYDEDDRDLDFIERAARRALHSDNDPDRIADCEEAADGIDAQIAALRKRIDDLLDNR